MPRSAASVAPAVSPLLDLVDLRDDRPVGLASPFGSELLGAVPVPLVQVMTATEQRARTSQAYVRTAVGERLRHRAHAVSGDALVVEQTDHRTGLVAITRLSTPGDAGVLRIETALRNEGAETVTVTALGVAVGIGSSEAELDRVSLSTARSEWLAENRWETRPLRRELPRLNLALHGQDGRGRFAVTSHGAWSSGEHLPAGVLVRDDGAAVAWQIEASAPWHAELSQSRTGAVLCLTGPTDLEHGFAACLRPGDEVEGAAVAVAASSDGLEGAVSALTAYRRARRAGIVDGLPVVYNDFMNTLMGQPSTEGLVPLIDAAAEAGAEVFCIDAGWFADPAIGDWWDTVGEWREAAARFSGGLATLTERIRLHGMSSGLWLEPEVVGLRSPAAASLPEDAFFHRFGERVREHDRYHLDLRHPAAVAHLDRTVDHLVERYGVSYLKLDYNINPGAGTEDGADSAALGLLGHARAVAEWMASLRRRHPSLSIENCASGAMRADQRLLEVTQLQSTSDQQDALLYPPVAVAAPMTIVPEQCGNWAYPAAGMSGEETAFTLVTGLSGRLYLSGFLHELSDAQRALVSEAVSLAKGWRAELSVAEPRWPLGLPGWDDEVLCLVLRTPELERVFVWQRGDEAREVRLAGVGVGRGAVLQAFPSLPGWSARREADGLVLGIPAGPTARVFEVR